MNRLLLGTRKGLVIYEHQDGDWKHVHQAHVGIPVPYATIDPRTGTLWACLDHGHWGQKLQRSLDEGVTWEEVTAPAYRDGDEIKDDVPATLSYLWVLEPGGAAEEKRLYIGTEPGGLFRSDDGGDGFKLVEGLWNHPSRTEAWFGGGRDHPGIHSVVVDPRDSRRVLVGISCADQTRNGSLRTYVITSQIMQQLEERLRMRSQRLRSSGRSTFADTPNLCFPLATM